MKPNRRFIFYLYVLIVIVLLSMTLNYALYKQGELYYLQLNAMRLDPLGLNAFQDPAPVEHGMPVVVFLGDSRAASWPAPTQGKYTYINRGIGAQTSSQVLARLDEHVKLLHPEIVIVQVGINDLKTIPLFPSDRKMIVENCMSNIHQMVDELAGPGATVILTTIFPVGRVSLERSMYWSDDVARSIIEVNTFIRSLASPKVIIFDAYTLLVDGEGNIRQPYSHDLLHLTGEGYLRLNEQLAPLLQNLPVD
jgi:lysophospholipase L1-like esterase